MLDIARRVAASAPSGPIRFTIASLVTDTAQYAAMLKSFREHGFGEEDCEFLFIDNSSANTLCAYRGLNRMLEEARGDYVILCHQDILLIDGRDTMEACLSGLEARDANWAVAGNAGAMGLGRFALRISDPNGGNRRIGNLPEPVHSLDENLIILKRAAGLRFSSDLSGFHFYGTDICILADVLGYSSYVIDFHVMHLGRGIINEAFHACQDNIARKYARAFRPRWIQTTCSRVFVSGTQAGHGLGAFWHLLNIAVPRKLSRLAGRIGETLNPLIHATRD